MKSKLPVFAIAMCSLFAASRSCSAGTDEHPTVAGCSAVRRADSGSPTLFVLVCQTLDDPSPNKNEGPPPEKVDVQVTSSLLPPDWRSTLPRLLRSALFSFRNAPPPPTP